MVVDATAVPPDRGGVGRYVDELLPALVAEGADLAVVVQAHDVGHYRELYGRGAYLPGVPPSDPAPRHRLLVRATLDGLAKMNTPSEIAAKRGKSVEDILG